MTTFMERNTVLTPTPTPKNSTSNHGDQHEGGAKEAPPRPSPVNPRSGCCWEGRFFFDALKAMVTRQLFILHCLLAVWRVTIVQGAICWLLTLLLLGILVETGVVLMVRRAQEWTWFQWSVFLYLFGCVPPIWMLEIHKYKQLHLPQTYNSTQEEYIQVISVELKTDDWIMALEQALLVLIIVGRWMMPKGELTRDQLSGLLLVHLGTASDIVDFLTLLAEKPILEEPGGHFVHAILFVWTWSLLQFPFVVTAKKDNADEDWDEEEEEEEKNRIKTRGEIVKGKLNDFSVFLETEAWGIFVSVVLQDGPFVIVRVISILKYKIVNYTNYFFACKNALVLLLQIYRLMSIYEDHKLEKLKAKKKAQERVKLHKLYTNTIWP